MGKAGGYVWAIETEALMEKIVRALTNDRLLSFGNELT